MHMADEIRTKLKNKDRQIEVLRQQNKLGPPVHPGTHGEVERTGLSECCGTRAHTSEWRAWCYANESREMLQERKPETELTH